MNKSNSLILLFLFFTIACNIKTKTNETASIEKKAYLNQKNQVDVISIQSSVFHQQLISNGCLKALHKSELKFRISEEISSIEVRNGQKVDVEAILAKLDDLAYQQKRLQAETTLAKSKLDLQNVLIGMGYDINKTESIPSDKMELARVKSGFSLSELKLAEVQQDKADYELRAPFSGVVANISQKVYEKASGEPFCTLIDDLEFEVSFSVLETELSQVKKDGIVQVLPFSLPGKVFKGKISEINPVVDKNGLIQIKALVKNPGSLMEGMNVKVLIENEIPNQWVVPKTAVVLRDNWEVLFKVVNGKAYWNYVEVLHENTDSYAIRPHPEKATASIAEGDTIIVTGNLNLAHESDIEIKQ